MESKTKKKQSTSKKVPIRKRKNLFIGVGMRIDFTKEDYKKFEKTLKNYTKANKWNLEKEKVGEEGYSILINSKPNLSPEEVLDFIDKIESMLKDIQDGLGGGRLIYPDDYTNIKYYDLGGDEENLLLGIHRFSEMMVINILSKNAIELHNEDPEIASKIFSDYAVDGNKILNVRLSMGNIKSDIFSKIKSFFGLNN